jgi:hypothetical protein
MPQVYFDADADCLHRWQRVILCAALCRNGMVLAQVDFDLMAHARDSAVPSAALAARPHVKHVLVVSCLGALSRLGFGTMNPQTE